MFTLVTCNGICYVLPSSNDIFFNLSVSINYCELLNLYIKSAYSYLQADCSCHRLIAPQMQAQLGFTRFYLHLILGLSDLWWLHEYCLDVFAMCLPKLLPVTLLICFCAKLIYGFDAHCAPEVSSPQHR